MRHRKRGRKLGRNHSHRRALLRNMASSLLLTLDQDKEEGKAKVPGRIVTTPAKAKEVQPFVERLITMARNSLVHERESEQWGIEAKRNSSEWEQWRQSDQWQRWAQTRAPYVAARQRVLGLLRDKRAVQILFDEVAPRFEDRPGGYTRILHLPQRRLGDAGATVILELIGEDETVTARRPAPVPEPPADEREATPAEEPEAADQSTSAEAPQTENEGDEAEAETAPKKKKRTKKGS
jgi:large subunit ribosomal protein L17